MTYAPHRRRGALADVTDRLKSRPKKTSKIPFEHAEPGDGAGPDPAPSAPSASKRLSVFGGKAGRDFRAEFPVRVLDARDLLPDLKGGFTPGALRGGTHLHSFSPDGTIVSSTYEDAVLLRGAQERDDVERNHPAVALTVVEGADGGVRVDTDEHPRNQSGEGFSVVATSHVDAFEADTDVDGIASAVRHCWIGRRGYRRRTPPAAGGRVAPPRSSEKCLAPKGAPTSSYSSSTSPWIPRRFARSVIRGDRRQGRFERGVDPRRASRNGD